MDYQISRVFSLLFFPFLFSIVYHINDLKSIFFRGVNYRKGVAGGGIFLFLPFLSIFFLFFPFLSIFFPFSSFFFRGEPSFFFLFFLLLFLGTWRTKGSFLVPRFCFSIFQNGNNFQSDNKRAFTLPKERVRSPVVSHKKTCACTQALSNSNIFSILLNN